MLLRGPGDETVYDLVGGQPWFDALVDTFYEGVVADPLLRPMYPEDLTESKRHLALFLAQYWGGPSTYSDERGHPRLRMRHVPFEIDDAAADAWWRHMRASVERHAPTAEIRDAMLNYFEGAARFLVNRPT